MLNDVGVNLTELHPNLKSVRIRRIVQRDFADAMSPVGSLPVIECRLPHPLRNFGSAFSMTGIDPKRPFSGGPYRRL